MAERKPSNKSEAYIAGSRQWNAYLDRLRREGKPVPINLRAGTVGQWVSLKK